MDNNKKLFEGLLKADGIDSTGATESERIAFETMLDERLKSKQTKPRIARHDTWRIIMKNKMTKFAAVIIGIVVFLPLAYGATKIVKHFLINGVTITVKNSDNNTEQDARDSIQYFGELYRKGKAKEVKPGVWVVVLPNGEEFAYSGRNPELVGLSQNDEIQKLREAGDFERTFIKEVEDKGIKTRLYEDRFTLSSGKIVTMTFGEGEDQPQKNL